MVSDPSFDQLQTHINVLACKENRKTEGKKKILSNLEQLIQKSQPMAFKHLTSLITLDSGIL